MLFPRPALSALLVFPLLLSAAPRVVSPDPDFDFGERRSGEVVRHTFQVENRGTDPLVIRDIRTSCGCTTPNVKTLELAPGAAKGIPVTIDLKGRTGPQTQYVTLTTNDPRARSFALKITGEAVADIRIEPRTLNLGLQEPGDPQTGTITLASTTGTPFRVKRARANRNRVDPEVDHTEDGLSATIRVTPRKIDSDGQFTDVVIIDTDHPAVRGERVLVMWQVSTGVAVTPSQVNLVVADRPQRLNRYLMVKGYPGMEQPLEVLEVEWPGHETVDVEVKDTKRFGWRIHLKNFTPESEMDGSEIRIHTNAEGFETLTVPVRVLQ